MGQATQLQVVCRCRKEAGQLGGWYGQLKTACLLWCGVPSLAAWNVTRNFVVVFDGFDLVGLTVTSYLAWARSLLLDPTHAAVVLEVWGLATGVG